MSRFDAEARGWFDGPSAAPISGGRGRPVRAPLLSWGGLGLAAALVAVALLAGDPPDGGKAGLGRTRFLRRPAAVAAVAFAPGGALAMGRSDGTLEVRDLDRVRPREF